MSKSQTLTVRLKPELRDRIEAARAAHPYRPSVTVIVERGLELALAEMEAHRLTSENGFE